MIPKRIVKTISSLASQLNALHRELEADQNAGVKLPVPKGRQRLKKERKDKYRTAFNSNKK